MSATIQAHRAPNQGRCGRCSGSVLWVPTAASGGVKMMPLDIDHTDDGLCILVPAGDGSGGVWVHVLGHHKPVPPELADEPRLTAHAWSCPGRISR